MFARWRRFSTSRRPAAVTFKWNRACTAGCGSISTRCSPITPRSNPFVTQLAQSLRRHNIEAVCGPLTGGAFLAQLLARLLGSEFYFTTPAPPEGNGAFTARYQLPPGIGHRLLGKRVAIVDDVMSAGSSLRATLIAIESHGAIPVVVGALHVLGTTGADFFKERGLRIETTGRTPFDSWRPPECPLCAAGVPLDDPSRPAI